MPIIPDEFYEEKVKVPPVIDRILNQLENVRRKDALEWSACCPVHDDNSPSFGIRVKADGRVLLNCLAGCAFEEVCEALKVTAAELAPKGAGGPARRNTLGKKQADPNRRPLDRLTAFGDRLLDGVLEREVHRMTEDRADPLPFPSDVFPKALQRFVEETARCLPCPPDYMGVSVLSVVSSFLGNARVVQVKPGWEERSVVWAMLVGPPGILKTPALEKAIGPARARDREHTAKHAEQQGEYNQRKHWAKEGKYEFNDDPPVLRQHVTTDTTVEALADVLTHNPRGLLVYRDEAVGWVLSLNQYKGGSGSDKQFWLSSWACTDYTVNRVGKSPKKVNRPFLSVVGNIPPDMLGELGDRRGREDGFTDRLLFAYPTPVPVRWTDESPAPELEERYVKACLAIGGLEAATLPMTEEARAEFAQWYDEHNTESDALAGPWAKMCGYCARFANILAHLRAAYRGEQELKSLRALEVNDVKGAIRLITYFKNHARRALGTMKAGKEEKGLARLLAYVKNAPNNTVYPRSLISSQIAPNAKEARRMLEELAAMGLGEMRVGERKDSVYFVGREVGGDEG